MLFKLAWTHSPEARDKTIEQFMKTGGMPPENIELLSRYHNLDGTGGFAILESTNPAALADFALDWNSLITAACIARMAKRGWKEVARKNVKRRRPPLGLHLNEEIKNKLCN